jgi:hypothetical protein
MSIPEEIEGLFDRLAAAWCALDREALRALWKPGLETPLYIAEEHEPVMTDWSQIEAYWAAAKASLSGMQSQYRVLSVTGNGPGQCLVAFKVKWAARVGALTDPIGGVTRGVALIEQVDGQPRLVAYIEAQLAPTVITRKLMTLVPESDRWL